MTSTPSPAHGTPETLRLTLVTSARHLPLRIRPAVPPTDDELYEMCQANRELRVERTAEGELLIMPPTGGKTGNRNLRLAAQLSVWADRDGTGVGFDSSTGFLLPNGAERSPDASWIRRTRWDALTPEQQERFPPLCPDFVAELRSPSDSIEDLRHKMTEYLDNGAALGWLVDPYEKRVEIYRPGEDTEALDAPEELSGDPVLPGFVLRLDQIW
jgi:Uma2 family endonuclease